MSNDAKDWKKDLLKSKGPKVVEYDGDFSKAVEFGRKKSNEDQNNYFVDDENSKTLFLAYAVATNRIKTQKENQAIKVDKDNPAFFYIPCGVGGSLRGVSFGLKKIFGDNCHIFFVKPTHSPSMLIGIATGLNGDISDKNFGIDEKTQADGLDLGRLSRFVGKLMDPIISGIFTIDDYKLFEYMRYLDKNEKIRIEPSACACFEEPIKLFEYESTQNYLKENKISDVAENIQHFSCETGGNLLLK